MQVEVTMRLSFLILSVGITLASPALSYEKLAALPPESTYPSIESTTDPIFHRKNAEAKAIHDQFDKRLDSDNRKIIASVCLGCSPVQRDIWSKFHRQFNAHEGSLTSADSIYSKWMGFNPAQAGGGSDR
ncbi:hypothetical protein [Methylobacterium sp. GC_Met_2]|uniref:hypothetical protein n=1 Tax=Methylobacterium sp. GC_Met_2 TaxID=2937376 RepID=UPI00226B291E|nr:hypothetical protein [Methylobacterium sp. GC_Met_2]